MDIAKCLSDGKTYNAATFANLPPRDIETKRKDLVCDECKAKAFFRKEAKSGQGACFGAKPHVEGCSLATVDTQKVKILGGEEDALYNPGNTIKIDLKFGAADKNFDVVEDKANGQKAGFGMHRGAGPRPQAKLVRRLSTILNNLIASEDFRNSDQIIEFEDKRPKMVKDFFINFDQVTDQHIDAFGGFWGLLTDARIANGSIWLNSGGRNHPSIPLNPDLWGEAQKRFDIDELEELAGVYFLVIGTLRIAGANKKKYIQVPGIEYFTIKI